MIDFVERMQEAAEAVNIECIYGTNSVINLIDAEAESLNPQVDYMCLLPVVRRPQFGNTMGINAVLYDFRMMLLSQTPFDHIEDGEPTDYYYQKYEYRVLPKLALFERLLKKFVCPGIIIQAPRIEEVVNQFNSNLDGILITGVAQINTQSYYSPIIPDDDDSGNTE